MPALETVSLKAIREAQGRLTDTVVRTPLVRLNVDDSPAEIFLKLENLQPIGSFKLRGAMQAAKKEKLQKVVWTASAGNWGQGVAWYARQLGAESTVAVPEAAPETKIAAIERLCARVVFAPYEDWLQIFRSRSYEGMKGLFIDDFSDPAVMTGHGTIGLEILEDLPDVEEALVAGSRAACVLLSQIPSFTPAKLRQPHPRPLRSPLGSR